MESRALVTARKLKDMNIETGAREIEDALPVELLASHAGDEQRRATDPYRRAGRSVTVSRPRSRIRVPQRLTVAFTG